MQSIHLVLFSEVNSKFGHPFLLTLLEHPSISVIGLITSPVGKLCPYYIDEEGAVDLETEARSRHIPVLRPGKVNAPEVISWLKSLQADYFIIANYQQILNAELLSLPKVATINFHPSPLPRYAGWAPFFWMAKHGEKRGGVSSLLVTPEIDAGPLIAQKRIALSGEETALAIRQSHFAASVDLLREVIPLLLHQSFRPVAQNRQERTYYGKPGEEDYWIDCAAERETILRTVRAGYRFPGAYALTDHGDKLIILSMEAVDPPEDVPPTVSCGSLYTKHDTLVAARDGWLRIRTIEYNGREVPLDARLLRGCSSFRISSPAERLRLPALRRA